MNINGNFVDTQRLDAKYANLGKIYLKTTYYKSIFINVGGFHTSYASTNSTIGLISASPSSNIASIDTGMWFLTTGATAALRFNFQMPSDWQEGSTIYPYIFWASTGSSASSAYATVGMVYTFKDLGTSASSYATLATSLQLVPDGSTAFTVHTTNFAAITSTCSIGSIFNGGIYINTTIANSTYEGGIGLQGLAFAYKVDTLGTTYSNVVDK